MGWQTSIHPHHRLPLTARQVAGELLMSESVITILELPLDLVKALRQSYDDSTPVSRETTGQRAQFDIAVECHLDSIVRALLEHGFGGGKSKRQRRKVNRETWDRLKAAEKKVGISRPALLRACLRLHLMTKK